MEILRLLLILAKRGCTRGSHRVSTAELSRVLLLSQQTISRDLRALEDQGFITRKPTPHGTHVSLTPKGVSHLASVQHELRSALGKTKQHSLTGTVHDWLFERRYYMSQRTYIEQFERLFGFVPYLGTLNLKVDAEQKATFLAGLQQNIIEGFRTAERTFGSLYAYPLSLKRGSGALIIPMRTMHPPHVVEIISASHLRSAYRLRPGMPFTVYSPGESS